MSKSAGQSRYRQPYHLRVQQTRAAWRVFLTRPMAAWVVLSILVLLIFALADLKFADVRLRNNAPSYTPAGKRLRDKADYERYLEPGATDTSIVGLDFSKMEDAEDRRRLMLLFPNVQWLDFSQEQLRETNPDDFKSLKELTAIELLTASLQAEDVERLSQISSLKHITLSAWRSDADLSLLKNLPNLTTAQISDFGDEDDRQKGPLLSKRHLHQIAQISTLEELILESPTILTGAPLDGDELSDAESRTVVEFAQALSPAIGLRTIYVGDQRSGAARHALRELRVALPNVSVRPALYINEFWGKLALSVFVTIFAIGVAILHFVTCSTLPQAVVVPHSLAAHGRVLLRVVLMLLAIQVLFLVVVLQSSVLAATAVSVAGLAVSVVTLGLIIRGDTQPRNTLPGVAVILIFLGCVFLAKVHVARVEWFLFGEQPAIAAVAILLSVLLVYRITSQLDIPRLRADQGIAPAAGMQSFMTNLQARNLQVVEKKFNEPLDKDAWQGPWYTRFEKLVDFQGTGPLKNQIASMRFEKVSLFARLRFWSIGLLQLSSIDPLQFSLRQCLFTIVFSGLIMFGTLISTKYLSEGILVVPSPTDIAMFAGVILFFEVAFVTVRLYGRFPMFAHEILRPVSRGTWRRDALFSTLYVMVTRTAWAWLAYYAIPLAITGQLDVMWFAASLFATIVFSVFAAGLVVWLVMVRRVLFTAGCCGLVLAAVLLVAVTLSEGRSPFGDFDPAVLISIASVGLAIGLVIFGMAWRRWSQMELA